MVLGNWRFEGFLWTRRLNQCSSESRIVFCCQWWLFGCLLTHRHTHSFEFEPVFEERHIITPIRSECHFQHWRNYFLFPVPKFLFSFTFCYCAIHLFSFVNLILYFSTKALNFILTKIQTEETLTGTEETFPCKWVLMCFRQCLPPLLLMHP